MLKFYSIDVIKQCYKWDMETKNKNILLFHLDPSIQPMLFISLLF